MNHYPYDNETKKYPCMCIWTPSSKLPPPKYINGTCENCGGNYFIREKEPVVEELELSLFYHPNTQEKINGATIVASLSTINLGV
jgi:hypothetical protein